MLSLLCGSLVNSLSHRESPKESQKEGMERVASVEEDVADLDAQLKRAVSRESVKESPAPAVSAVRDLGIPPEYAPRARVNRWCPETERRLLADYGADRVSPSVKHEFASCDGDITTVGTLRNPHIYNKQTTRLKNSTLGLSPYRGVESAPIYKGDYVMSFCCRVKREHGKNVSILYHVPNYNSRAFGEERPERKSE
jgi:hypothetical protein